jgi:hypothetical protein
VAHWPKDKRDTTLAFVLIRIVAETAQHAGHADIIRELIDGRAAPIMTRSEMSLGGESTSLGSRPQRIRSRQAFAPASQPRRFGRCR